MSQNTSDVNSTRAYESLVGKAGYPLRPDALLKLGVSGIAEAIRVSGMQYIKAKTIINLVNSIRVKELVELDPMELRAKLLSVRGIGYKTADVFLLIYRKYPVFPIDTHIRRVLIRYGAVKPGDSYERARSVVESVLPRDPEYLVKAHLSLIKHGRTICRARKPDCQRCLVSEYCAKAI
ncbi:MAG: hypothetical protein QW780_04160 [Sulfolobales archaeon]